jgi:hypothetical protein
MTSIQSSFQTQRSVEGMILSVLNVDAGQLLILTVQAMQGDSRY